MHRVCQAQGQPAARLNRRFALSPIDALIDLVVRCGLRCQIPVRFDFDTLTHLRITALPQRWPASGDMRGAWEGAPMCSKIFRLCVPSVVNAISRICPPHIGHSSAKTS